MTKKCTAEQNSFTVALYNFLFFLFHGSSIVYARLLHCGP